MTGLAVRSTAPGELHGFVALDQIPQHDPGLEPGQRRTQAEVGPKTEAHMRVGVTVDAQLAGVGPEHPFVTIGRGVHQQHRITRSHLHSTDGGGRRSPSA